MTKPELAFSMSYLPEYLTAQLALDSKDANGISYDTDCAWFKANPHRNLMVREELRNEYRPDFNDLRIGTNGKRASGASPNVVEDLTIYQPLTLVLVIQLATGIHQRRAVWIGSRLYPEFRPSEYDTDTAVAHIIAECAKRGHGNVEAIERWRQRVRRSYNNDPSFMKRRLETEKTDGKVH